MGLFSTKKKPVFSTTVERMIDDESIPNSAQAAVANYILSSGLNSSLSGRSIPDHLIEATQNALPAKVKSAYRYAKAGHYAYGLPTSSVSRDPTVFDIEATIQSYLDNLTGKPVSLIYGYIEEANHYHFMWKLLIDSYGYNPTTNELEGLTASKGFACYLKTAKIFYTAQDILNTLDLSYLDQWGLSTEHGATLDRTQDLGRAHVDYVEDPLAENTYAVIEYEFNEVILDTTPPNAPKIKSYDGITVKGVAEVNSTVSILDPVGLVLGTVIAGSSGLFEVILDNPQPEPTPEDPEPAFVIANPVIDITSTDAALNVSAAVTITAPFEDPTDLGVGDTPTQLVIKREEQFNLSFLDYFNKSTPDTEEYAEDIEEGDVDPPDESEDGEVEPPTAPDHIYVMAAYTYENLGITEIGYLTYIYDSGGIPEFDDLLESEDASGEYFPRLYATLDGQKLNHESFKTTDKYKSSVRMGKRIGIDWSGFVDSLYEAVGGNAGKVKSMFATFCAPLNTDDPVISEYLFRFFDKTYPDLDIPASFNTEDFPNVMQGLTLSVKDEVYDHSFGFDGLGKDTITGSIGAVGTYKSEYVAARVIGTSGYLRLKYTVPYHTFKFQFSATQYYEYRVYSAVSRHSFNGGSTSVSGNDEALVIPLDRSALPKMTAREQEILFCKCFYMFINIYTVIKTKWYQRGAFKVVMAIVAIVISVVTVGAGAPLAAYVMAAAYAVAISVAISIALSVLAKILVKLGLDSGIITIIAAIIAIIAVAVGAGANAGKLLDLSAKALIQVANAGFNLASRMNSLQMKEILKQLDSFQSFATSEWERLDKAQELLTKGVPLEMEILMSDVRSSILINVGESADVFLTRTIGLGNVGTLCFDMLSTYADTALSLPSTYQTMKMLENKGE